MADLLSDLCTTRLSRWNAMAAVAGMLIIGTSAPVLAEDSPGMAQMRIAEQQAAEAASTQDLEQAKLHLQQALNCLVGRGASEYRPAVGDPCKGASARRNLPSKSVNRIRVQKAIRLASVGVTFHDFKPAHFTSQAVQAVLEEGTR
jgi:hypothetical protein